jgi:hypothetical protein
MEQELKSLRQIWRDQPEERLNVEAAATKIHEELAMLRRELPPSIAEVAARQGEDTPVLVLEAMILSLVEYLNIGKNMTPAQIKQTAATIAAEHPTLTLEHFAVVFQRARLGQWGEQYDRLDGVIIARWVTRYVQEIAEFVQQTAENRHLSLKQTRAGDMTIYSLRDLPTKAVSPEPQGAPVPPLKDFLNPPI